MMETNKWWSVGHSSAHLHLSQKGFICGLIGDGVADLCLARLNTNFSRQVLHDLHIEGLVLSQLQAEPINVICTIVKNYQLNLLLIAGGSCNTDVISDSNDLYAVFHANARANCSVGSLPFRNGVAHVCNAVVAQIIQLECKWDRESIVRRVKSTDEAQDKS